ncbi:hypothetical protein cypCar_00025256 [Cyprinus carpio]|nr:hypothetical protein cypCar_00025256 [Cyprinus carpio]
MANFLTRNLHLDLCVIIILLIHAENQIRPKSPKEMPLHIIIIIISCCGVIVICLIITISICIHRRWKNSKDSSQREAGQDFSQAPARGRIQTHNSQYFERYNSVYGQI